MVDLVLAIRFLSRFRLRNVYFIISNLYLFNLFISLTLMLRMRWWLETHVQSDLRMPIRIIHFHPFDSPRCLTFAPSPTFSRRLYNFSRLYLDTRRGGYRGWVRSFDLRLFTLLRLLLVLLAFLDAIFLRWSQLLGRTVTVSDIAVAALTSILCDTSTLELAGFNIIITEKVHALFLALRNRIDAW